MTLLPLPEPYDFELSTERFRAFGPDLANLWYEGGIHRVVGGREFRIEAAPGGVDVEPLDEETEPVARAIIGVDFELEPFYAWAQGDGVLRELVPRLAGLRPPLAPDPYETLVSAITEPIDKSTPPAMTTTAWATAANARGRTEIPRPCTPARP